MPEVHLGNSASTAGDPHDTEGLGRKSKVRQRSYSAMLPRNATVDQMRELTANLSITKQTGLIPEEGNATNTTTEPRTAHTIDSILDKKQTHTDTSQNGASQIDAKDAQKSTISEQDVDTVDTPAGKIQILPPVVRQGELGMKIEVKRLRTFSDSVISETTSTSLVAADKKSQSGTVATTAAINSRTVKRLPKLQEKEKKEAEISSHLSRSPETKERLQDDLSDRTLPVTMSSSSLRKVSIVSLGETPSKSQQTDVRHRQHKRKRRHSEGKLVGSGSRLSQGWSPPQLETIEPIVGSPLHTPRGRQSQTTAAGVVSLYAGRGPGEPLGSESELEALRSQMTSPGMLISVDVNEFLQDIDVDNPT